MSKHSALINRVTNTVAKRMEKTATPGKRYIIILDDEEPITIKTRGTIFPNVPMPNYQSNELPKEEDDE